VGGDSAVFALEMQLKKNAAAAFEVRFDLSRIGRWPESCTA